jgi:Tol biopolymer transport system component
MKKTLMIRMIAIIIMALFLTGCAKAEITAQSTKSSIEETDTTTVTASDSIETPETTQEAILTGNPEIVFYSSDSSIATIYICNPDGSILQPLIEGGINTSPSWNREHSKIVFTSIDSSSGVSGLYIFDIQNKNKTLLLKRFSPRDPSFSPNGNTIVFADFVEDGSENAEIYKMGIELQIIQQRIISRNILLTEKH